MKSNLTLAERDAFFRRYIERRIYHLHSKRIFRIPFLRPFIPLLVRLELLLFRKPVMPCVEYVVTTRCSLHCVDCANYIPTIPPEKQYTVTPKEFKENLANLLCGVRKINLLGLLGGEPLLNCDLSSLIDIAGKERRIEHVLIVTNGTIMASTELLAVLKKFRHKCSVTVSNDTGNPQLCRTLKSKEIKKQLEENGITCHLDENIKWIRTLPCRDFKRSAAEMEHYFLTCKIFACSILKRKLYVCPKAETFDLLGICPTQPGEFLDLSQPCQLREVLNFFKNSHWSSCNYCTIHEKTEIISPAIQPE